MNGSFLVVFTYEDTVGRLRLNLNSLTQSDGPAEGVETFNGWGNEVVNGHDFYFSIKNGEVKEGINIRPTVSIFEKKRKFSIKKNSSSIFDQIFDFWRNLRFLTKSSIFVQIFDF